MDQLTGKNAKAFVKKFEALFKGLPHLPKGIVDFFVSIAPWMIGLGGIMSVYGGITALFFAQRGNVMWQYVESASGVWGGYFTITAITSLLVGTLYLMAFSPLKNRKLNGWMLLFWANILGLVQSGVAIVFGYGGLVGALISAFIGFYILFEMKKSYK